MNRRRVLRASALLLGTALSPACQRALESGADLSAPPVGGSLSARQRQLVGVLADLIIPATDTPGAVAAGVPAFIEQIVVDWYTAAELQIFLDGLAELDDAARAHWSVGFLEIPAARQAQLLRELEPPLEGSPESSGLWAGLPPGASGDVPFYQKLKELTVLGYYTSEAAAGTELEYRPMPGSYDGDALFGGRQWTR